MTIRDQIFESLKKGDALTMQELVDAHGWDDKQKACAYQVIMALRKSGEILSSVEAGRGLYQLADSNARPADKGPSVARASKSASRPDEDESDGEGDEPTPAPAGRPKGSKTEKVREKPAISPVAAKALRTLKQNDFESVIVKPVKPVEAVTGIRVRTSTNHVLIQTMEPDGAKVAHTLYIAPASVGPLIAALRDAKAAIA